MLEAAIRWTARALDANEQLIRGMVKKKANWVLKLAGLTPSSPTHHRWPGRS